MAPPTVAFRRFFARDAYRPRPAPRLSASIAACSKAPASVGTSAAPAKSWIAVYGGTSLAGAALDDLWLFDVAASSWRCVERPKSGAALASWPPPLRDAAFVFAGGALYLWGGTAADEEDPVAEASGVLWRLEVGATWRWTRVPPAGAAPPGRTSALLMWDPFRSRLVLWGGSSAPADLWFFSLDDREWAKAPRKEGDEWPEPTACCAGWISQDGAAMAVFGGGRDDPAAGEPMPVGDTWMYLFEEERWVRLPQPPAGGPGAQDGAAGGTLGGVHVLFGGRGAPADAGATRCFAFDFGPAREFARTGAGGLEARWWTPLSARGAPSRRSHAALVTVPFSNQFYLVGGRALKQAQAASFIDEVYTVSLSGVPGGPAGSRGPGTPLQQPPVAAPATCSSPSPSAGSGAGPQTPEKQRRAASASAPPTASGSSAASWGKRAAAAAAAAAAASPTRSTPSRSRPKNHRLGKNSSIRSLALASPPPSSSSLGDLTAGRRESTPRRASSAQTTFSEQLATALEELAREGQASLPKGAASLGREYFSEGDEVCLELSLDGGETPLGPEGALSELERRGQECMQLGDFAKADRLFRRAVTASEKELGPEHSRTALCLRKLADACMGRGLYEEAQGLMERALAIQEATLGPSDLTIATCCALAVTYSRLGKDAAAESLLKRALAKLEAPDSQAGEQRPAELRAAQVSCACSLGEVYYHRGDFAEAEALFRRALEVLEQGAPADGGRVVSTLAALGATLTEQGRSEEAVPLLRRAVVMQEALVGPEHPSCGPVLESLARALWAQGRTEEAEPLFERAAAAAAAGAADNPEADVSLDQLMGRYPPQETPVKRPGEEPRERRAAAEELARARAELEAARDEASRLATELRAAAAASQGLQAELAAARLEAEGSAQIAREAKRETARARAELEAAAAEAEQLWRRAAEAERAAEEARREAAAASADALHARREAVAARAAPPPPDAGALAALEARAAAAEARLAESVPVGPALLAGLSVAELQRAHQRLAAGVASLAAALAEARASEARGRAAACLGCGARPRSVLALPCRHLALCDACFEGPAGGHCPLCGAAPDRPACVHGALLS